MSLVDLGKRLLDAAKRGDTDEVRALMSNGAPFTTDWLGTSPLHFAAQNGHISTAEVLLRAGISRDARTKVDRTPLHVACQEGYSEIVDLLLNHSADIEAKDMLKMTPLHWSVENGHLEVIGSLLKRGANVSCCNKFDKSPIDIAYSRGRPDIVQLLQSAETAKAVEDAEESHFEPTTVEESIEEVTTTDSIVAAEAITDENGTATITIGGGDGSDQSSTSVLATLAALAEATAPFSSSGSANTTAAEALNWLETHGITMISAGESPAIVSSALETGHILTLTEAGKLALNAVKPDGTEETEVVEEETITETIIDGELHEVPEEDETQKVITIVSDGNGTEGAVMVVEDGGQITEVVEEEDIIEEPPYKRLKTEEDTIIITAVGEDGEEVAISQEDQENLRKQLEQVQKEAAVYKQQLKQKEQEAEEYKKKLNKMTPVKS